MRSPLLSLLACGFLLVACNNNKPNSVTVTSKDGETKATVDVSPGAVQDIQKKMDELKNLPPLTPDQVKAKLPEELMGMKRTNFSASDMSGFTVAEATYKKEEGDERIRVVITDCVGIAGSAFYSMNFYTRVNIVEESDNGYTKSVEFNGGKAIEKYSKNSDEYELIYSTDRLLVQIEGRKVGLDAIKEVAKNLDLK